MILTINRIKIVNPAKTTIYGNKEGDANNK